MNRLGKAVLLLNKSEWSFCIHGVLCLFLFIVHIAFVRAADLAISRMDVASMAGDKLQIQLEMNGPAIVPKVFHTDNPARIALDFSGVKNALNKKMYPINQGTVNSVYIAEATDRVRVVVNLLESTPFETRVLGNKVLLTLSHAAPVAPPAFIRSAGKPTLPPIKNDANANISALIPEQAVSGFDFKRGDKGEGRILVALANPNTIVNSRQAGGKVIISLLNTRLPENLSKRLDVSEFATPVKFIDATSSSQEAIITVTTQNDLYDYSLFQSEGLLTIEFRPLTVAEKEALDRTRTKYTGNRLSLNFQDIEIRNVIAILAEFTGKNVVAGDDVTGAITLKLDDVPWDEALDFIMMTKGLGKYETGNVILISPLDKIREYKEKQRETEAVVEQLDPLLTEYITINYAKAESFRNLLNGQDTGLFGMCGMPKNTGSIGVSGNIAGQARSQGKVQSQGANQSQYQDQTSVAGGGKLVRSNQMIVKDEQFALLSLRGSAVVDARTNTLIVRETAKQLEEIKKMIRKLDVPVRQVMIESRIAIVTKTFAKELGVRFGVAGNTVYVNSGTGPVGSVNDLGGTTGTINGTAILNDALVDLAASNPYGALGMTLARGADYVLNLELSALQDEGLGELISNPRVVTSDRCQASIKQGVEIAYQTSSANLGTNIEFKEALLQLDVLPQITPSGTVLMDLLITKDVPRPSGIIGNDQPAIDTRKIQTNVLVKNGETIVLGGVFEEEKNNSNNKVPFLADVPGIGFLFKKTVTDDTKRELLIFVTPKIMKEDVADN
jgi:type IV pilus assembly protein PilQ